MKKIFIALFLIMAFLVILIPLASSNPDGLEKVVETYGAQESQSPWKGIMADYSIFSIENQYVSTLVAGIFGVIVVLVTGLLVSKALAPKH
jgi:hypothetical protein